MKIGGFLTKNLFENPLVRQMMMMTVYIVNKYIMQAKNYGMISRRRTFWKTLKSQISQVLFRQMLLNHLTGLPSLIGYFCLSAIGGHTLMLPIVELNFCYSFFMHSLLFYQSASHGCPFLWYPFHQVCTC